MNATAAAIVARLKAAGLLDVAERAAKRVELRLADCIEPGDVTGGHRALWTALAKEKKTPVQIAAIVGFTEAVVAAELPEPESGPRTKKVTPVPAPTPFAPPGADLTALVSLIAAAEDRVEKLHRAAARVLEEAQATSEDLRSLRAALDGADVAASNNARAIAVAHLRSSGDMHRVVEKICATHGVPPERLLMGVRDPDTLAARRASVVAMTERRWSQVRIAVLLRIDKFSVLRHQRTAGVKPARKPIGGKKAAA